MSFLLSQTSTGFSSAEVLLTNLATIFYLRELNLINQPKTLTVLVVLVSHQIINNIIEATRSVELPILQYSSRKNSKKIPQQWPINFNELLSVAHLSTHSQ